MAEHWKPIPLYEGLYEVSDYGNVRSLKRATTSGKMLKGTLDKDGYIKVCLSKNNLKKTCPIHRLVANAFIPNPDNLPCINHLDENKQNNVVGNLEWCTVERNNNYNNRQYRAGAKRRKWVVAERGSEKLVYQGVYALSKALGVNGHNISGCLHGYYGRKSVNGYTFRFAENAEIPGGQL
ncbi:MAG: HNH endonuclease [Clostridia bacterium]|nr:HNH endonuclease [Clostridia bacterium]